jgi:hypothetical protein
VLLIFSLQIHFPFLLFLLPSKSSVIRSKAPLGFFRFHSISHTVDLASWILVHVQFYLSAHAHSIGHHFLPGLKFSVSSSAPVKAEHARDFVRFDTTQKIFPGVLISVTAADFSLLLVFLRPDSFLSAAFGSLGCFSPWSRSKSSNASCFWFSLLWRLSLLSAAGLIAVPLAADFFTRDCGSIRSLPPPLSHDCLVSASCCSS